MNRRWKVAATGCALAALAACNVPTAPPQWDQTWVVPGEEITLGVAELLPSGVALTSDSSAFVVNISGTSVAFTLGDFCTACAILDGLTAPKPAFDTTLTTTETLPADLVSATASGGQFSLTISHQFSFDPLRPSPSDSTNTGYLVVVVRSAGRVVAMDSIDGADPNGAFPANTPRTLIMPVNPGPIADSLVVEVSINSPLGDPTAISTSAGLSAALNPGTLDVSDATVAVSNIAAQGTSTTMDLSGLPDFVINHVQSGALRFTIDNPFDVSGSFTLTLDPPSGPPITKVLTIAPGTSTPRIDFTGTELGTLLGQSGVAITTNGSLTATGGTVTVSPSQVMTLKTDLEITDLVGGTVNQ